MAGFSFEDLIRRAKEGKKPVDHPSTAAALQAPAVDIDPRFATPPSKNDRLQSKGKEVESDMPRKKPKLSKEKDQSKRSHPSLDLERPSESDFERFKADPLLFAAEIARAGSRLLAKMKQGEEERTAGMLLYAKNLWLEGDNLDKTDKLNRAYDHISELRQQLEAATKKAEEAEAALQPTTNALTVARESLKSVEKERDTAVENCSKAEQELRMEKGKSAELEKKVAKLSDELGLTVKRADYAEVQWHKVDDEFNDLVQSTVALCGERFEEAIRQVRYVYPTYEINEKIINSAHTMKGGRIVIPERKSSDGQIVDPEVVIYERPA